MFRGTTVVSVRKNGVVSIGGDGQVTLGDTVFKGNACKIRKLYNNKIIAGFAGGTADAFTLFEKFDVHLQKHQGNLIRSAIDLAKEWRGDRALRCLEALLCVADKNSSFIISGSGDVIEPENSVMAIGSGGDYAKASALALLNNTDLPAEQVVRKSLEIAADLCIYTNNSLTLESLCAE